MAQLTTTYSKELKEKIFILKGEEGYARTTDTLLDEILHNGERLSDWDTHKEYMLLEFRVDVLRDLGASQIVLYDNDEIIGVYDFAVGTHTIEFKYTSPLDDTRLKLEYGVEHNIYARYMGNKQCLKSTSKKYNFYEPVPERFESSISFSGLDTNYDTGDDVEFTATLSAYQVDNKTLNVYVDDTKYGEVTTDANGTASVSITDLTDGKYTISVEYMGGEYSTATSKSKDISIGYIVNITNVPSYVINSEPVTLNVEIKDHLGHYATEQYTMSIYDNQGNKLSENVTIWNGYGGISNVVLNANQFRVGFAFPYAYDYSSDYYQTSIYDNVTVSMNPPNPLIVSTNYSSTLTGSLTNVTAPVKVSINQGVGDVMTDSNGNFTASYRGTGAGDVTVTASVYGSSASVTIEDVVQYWKVNGTSYNYGFRIRAGEMTSLTNGWKFYNSSQPVVSNSNWIGGNFYPVYYSPLIIQYKIVSTSTSSITFHCGRHFDDNISVSGVKAGDIVKITMDSNKVAKLYLNDTLKGTFAENVYEAGYIGFILPSSNNIIINEVKLKRWNDE